MEETREQKIEFSFNKLSSNLEDLTKLYRSLLDLLRREKDVLIEANIEKINESNQAKEAMLYKLRSLDSARERYARELAALVKADVTQPRLLEIAQKISGTAGDRLRAMHSTLELLVKRVFEVNKDNEAFVKSALQTVTGALGELKDTLAPKKTYGRNAKMTQATPETAGNFSSKEA